MNLTVKKVGEIKGTFVIESYQRGYRWTEEEIKFLLEVLCIQQNNRLFSKCLLCVYQGNVLLNLDYTIRNQVYDSRS